MNLTSGIERLVKGCNSVQYKMAEMAYEDVMSMYGCVGSLTVIMESDHLENTAKCIGSFSGDLASYVSNNRSNGTGACGAVKGLMECWEGNVGNETYVLTNQIMPAWTALRNFSRMCHDRSKFVLCCV